MAIWHMVFDVPIMFKCHKGFLKIDTGSSCLMRISLLRISLLRFFKTIYIKIHVISVRHSFFLTPFPWINLIAKHIYGFLWTRRRYSDHFRVNWWDFVQKVFVYHILKSVLPNTILKKCPSEHNTQKVSFRTWCHVSFRTWSWN